MLPLWATIAVEAEDIMQAIAEQVEKERREKQAEALTETHAGVSVKKLTETKDDNSCRTEAKAAELFNTNRALAEIDHARPILKDASPFGNTLSKRSKLKVQLIAESAFSPHPAAQQLLARISGAHFGPSC